MEFPTKAFSHVRSSWDGWLPAVILYLSIPFVALFHYDFDFIWSKQAASNFFLLLAVVASLPLLIQRPLGKLMSWDFVVLFLLTVWAGVSVSWAIVPIKVFKSCTVMIASIVGFGLGKSILGDKSKAIAFLAVSVSTGLVVASYGVLQYHLDSGVFTMPNDQFGFKDATTSYGLSNFTAGVLVIIFPFGLGLAFSRINLALRWLGLVSSILIFYYVLVSHVRAGYISLFCAATFLTVLLFLRQRYLKVRRVRTIICVAVLTILASVIILANSSFRNTLFSTFNIEHPTIQIRLHTWKQALAIVRDHPVFGVGLGNYDVIGWKYLDETQEQLIIESNTRMDRTHNEYLNLTSELGLPGLLAFLTFLGLTISGAVAWLRASVKHENFWIVAALTAGILSGLVDAIFTFPFQVPGSIHAFFLSAGVLSGLVFQSDALKARVLRISFRTRKLLQGAGSMVAVVGLLIAVNWNINFLTADIWYQKGLWLMQQGKNELALEAFNKGLDFEPFAEKIHYDRAFVLTNLGRVQEAIASLESCLEYAPFFGRARTEHRVLLATHPESVDVGR